MKKEPPLQRWSSAGLYAFFGSLAAVASVALLPGLRSTDTFLPHAYCYQWQPNLIRLHLISDALIGLSYAAIPLVLLHIIRKRGDLPFNWMFILFGVFIVACGATHWMEVWTLWNPNYWLAGALKAVTAAASVPTAILLYLLIPRALALPSNRQLEAEVRVRKEAEAALQEARDRLEQRVAERTAQLQQANASLEEQRLRLEQAAREKSEFLAILSHEIRNPLQAITTSAQVVKLGTEDAMRARALGSILRQVGRLGTLLEGLLDVTRASRELSVNPQPNDMRTVVEHAVETATGYLAAKAQTLAVSLPPEAVTVVCDAGRIEQVVVNLVQNASKFTPEGGRIGLTVERSERWARIVVTDSGRGLHPDEIPGIFAFFHQGAPSEAAVKGLGIGLHIVRQIVQAHGGRVEASSEGAGRGSTFVVDLPIA